MIEHYFVGVSLSASANVESGVAVLDKNNQIIFVDKMFTMNDVQYFFDNFSSLKNSKVCISLPWDNSMLNGKWRILSKPYQLLNLKSNDRMKNADNWTQRYSNRGAEYFNGLVDSGVSINRFELYLTRQALKLESCYKERSPADCKALQNALRLKYGFNEIPSNMMPMAQLEAIVGAILAKNLNEKENSQKSLFEFNGIEVVRG